MAASDSICKVGGHERQAERGTFFRVPLPATCWCTHHVVLCPTSGPKQTCSSTGTPRPMAVRSHIKLLLILAAGVWMMTISTGKRASQSVVLVIKAQPPTGPQTDAAVGLEGQLGDAPQLSESSDAPPPVAAQTAPPQRPPAQPHTTPESQHALTGVAQIDTGCLSAPEISVYQVAARRFGRAPPRLDVSPHPRQCFGTVERRTSLGASQETHPGVLPGGCFVLRCLPCLLSVGSACCLG